MAGFVKRSVKGTGKTIADWMDLTVSAGVFLWVKDIFVSVFFPWKREPAGNAETFQEAMERMKLTEADINQRQRMFLHQTVIYFLVAMAVIGYGVMLAFDKAITGMLMAFLVSFVAFANAFRTHFWYFQTKQRKLGCSFQEWLNSSLKG